MATRELHPAKQARIDAIVAQMREALTDERDPVVRIEAIKRAHMNYETNSETAAIMRRYGWRPLP